MKFECVLPPNGKLRIKKRTEYDTYVSSLVRDKDVDIILDISVKRKRRSLPLNNYYWGVVVEMITDCLKNDLGWEVDKDITHQILKERFLYTEAVDPNGEVYKIPKKSSELTNSEFLEYIENCKRFGVVSLNIYVPDPNEQLEIE